MQVSKGGALTVGQVKAALAGVPDDVEIGASHLDLTGWISKVSRVLYDKDLGIVTFDADKHDGTFTDEEVDLGNGMATLAKAP